MSPYQYHAGRTPLLISMPHAGTFVPAGMLDGMTERARTVPDTDWHVDRLYDFAKGLGASLLVATHSRYVIDVNRPPDDRPLYPGAENSELCPITLFDRSPALRCEPQQQLLAIGHLWPRAAGNVEHVADVPSVGDGVSRTRRGHDLAG